MERASRQAHRICLRFQRVEPLCEVVKAEAPFQSGEFQFGRSNSDTRRCGKLNGSGIKMQRTLLTGDCRPAGEAQ